MHITEVLFYLFAVLPLRGEESSYVSETDACSDRMRRFVPGYTQEHTETLVETAWRRTVADCEPSCH